MNRYTLVTGGAGFIGTNLAHRLLTAGYQVLLFDNLARPGSRQNFHWLRQMHGSMVKLETGDIRDLAAVQRAVASADAVFHFAGQVAVTTSLRDPWEDLDINARGTLNVLSGVRRLRKPPALIFASTSKVYRSLEDAELEQTPERYEPVDPAIRKFGLGENRQLEFQSPYACSKGAADQYVIQHARQFGLPAVVFRLSSVYGPHQSGVEEQGWVTHFLTRAIEHQPVTIFGDGKQARDLLFVDDLVDALLLARSEIAALSGQAFNIGGGPSNLVSLQELLRMIAELRGVYPPAQFTDWRPGDPRYYASDFRRFQVATGWGPRIEPLEGVIKLHEWLFTSGKPSPAVMRSAG